MTHAEIKEPRRLPIGAEARPGGVHFRVWAPARRQVAVVFEPSAGDAPQRDLELQSEPAGYWSGWAAGIEPGRRYRYRLDRDQTLVPDPASRFQPDGPHGPSAIVDPSVFDWTDRDWPGVSREGQVIYEIHVGTFTPEGTWAAAARQLAGLADLGVTLIEVMPVAEFAGRFGWGYDGVCPYAPTRLYGTPDDFRRFVDRAHALRLGVILDVVYNHLGPDGNYLKQFATAYFTDRYRNDWGEAINFDGDDSGPVREFFVENAGYWIAEYHLDGLRLDATQDVADASAEHVLAAIARRSRAAAGRRSVFLVAENEPQDTRLIRPTEQGGYGLDALWNDDFHHAAMVALTGRAEAYYTDYRGTPQELVSAAKYGFLFQGQQYSWQKKRRGTPTFGLPASSFVTFIQNHDQIANSARGERLHTLTSAGRHRAMTALLLLGPGTPMLFQGQELSAASPFLYFADLTGDLGEMVRRGRADFLKQFPSLARPEIQDRLPDPVDEESFRRSKVDLARHDSGPGAEAYALHRDLLALRAGDPVFRAGGSRRVDGAVLAPQALVLRFFRDTDDRLLVVNLGHDLALRPAPEPLLAPPPGCRWDVLWSSEDPRYGGHGATPVEVEGAWSIPGEAAVALRPVDDRHAAPEIGV
jgi:maltooligosyltrehalose trehalohydrolase